VPQNKYIEKKEFRGKDSSSKLYSIRCCYFLNKRI